jgi:hypothetical protein
MKKRLNVDAIANELRGGSAFFPDYQTGGHTDIVHTYWYLEATPELMTDIATAAEALVAKGDATIFVIHSQPGPCRHARHVASQCLVTSSRWRRTCCCLLF